MPVFCNVYDLCWSSDDKDKEGKEKKKKVNSGMPGLGFGIYHSGIEVNAPLFLSPTRKFKLYAS